MSGLFRHIRNEWTAAEIWEEYENICWEGVKKGVLESIERCVYEEKPVINGRKKPGPRKKECWKSFKFTPEFAKIPADERQKYYEAVYVVDYIGERKCRAYLKGRVGNPFEVLPEFLHDRLYPPLVPAKTKEKSELEESTG